MTTPYERDRSSDDPPGPAGTDWPPIPAPWVSAPRLERVIPRPLLAVLLATASLPAGSVLLALLFGLIALPTIVLGVPAYDMSQPHEWVYDPAGIPPLSAPALEAAIGAVLTSVLVAAPIGAFLVRRQVIVGALATIVIAWLAGIVALPVLPSALGFRYDAVNFCLDSCYPAIRGLGGGIDVFIIDGKPNPLPLIFSPLAGFPPLVALVIGVSLWAPLVRRASRQTGSNR